MRMHIFFSGQVQGVGFRYTAQSCARRLNVTGWVKNLADGRVECLAEGPRGQLEEFVTQLEKHFAGKIRQKDLEHLPGESIFEDFDIRY